MRRLLTFGLIGFAAQLIDGALGMAICLIWAASLSVSVASVRRDQRSAVGMAPS